MTKNTINIGPGEIHLWFVDDTQCHDTQLLSQYQRMLNAEECIKQQRFHFPKRRHQYLVSRALIRTVLSFYEPTVFPKQWQFKKNSYGKPFIKNSLTRELKFNLSHTEKQIVLAITLNKEIGTDVENLQRSNNTNEIAKHFFSPTEIMQLSTLPSEKQRNRFFSLWTLKEAYIKACGDGLSIPLNHLSYDFCEKESVNLTFNSKINDQADFWQFWQICPNNHCIVSVAIKSDPSVMRHSLIMKKIIPLAEITTVNYPITIKPSDASKS